MTTAWVLPTARATAWSPLAVVVSAVLLLGAVVQLAGGSTSTLLDLSTALAAAAVAAGLRDPARALLASVPTSPFRRRAHRLAVLVPASVGTWCLLTGLARLTDPEWNGGLTVAPLVALTATAVAVVTWTPERWLLLAGASAPLAWFAADHVLRGHTGPLTDLASAWHTHPWMTTAVAVTAAALGRKR